jgi:SAM-dependent methyltransferase
MDRGSLGRLPRPPRLDDESYQAFVEGLRTLSGATLSGPAAAALAKSMGASPGPGPRVPRAALRAAGDRVPLIATRNRILRTSQAMMWRNLQESFAGNAASLLAELDEYEARGPGSVEWDPAFEAPAYTQAEFHTQPGGYQRDPLAGFAYHYGTKVFFTGMNDQDEIHEEAVRAAVIPADGNVGRVLDLACSVGQGTTALKTRFARAEVVGIDVAAPLLRYAHRRAVQRGIEVQFRQRLAERTGFPDAHFDLVHSLILFHETPFEKTREIVREMHRILRPGGTFNVFDFPSGMPLPPSLQYFLDIDSQWNGEPWSLEFVHGDFRGALEDAGFEVRPGPPAARYLSSWLCTRR